MKTSLKWLRNYIELNISFQQLVDVLNNIGLVVESWEKNHEDVILDIETYANRPDTLGHLGIARELAAALRLPLKEENEVVTETEEKTSDLIDIQIYEENLCPRYSGIIVRDIPVGPSPQWLKTKINAIGLKPINNVVDVTNFVLFSTAHPLHAFDLSKISGSRIIVRKANREETLRSLEGEDIPLSSDMLVIADKEKPIALAGIIGGEKSAVSDSTRDVFIESACFNAVSIRKTRKKVGIETDASYRFERGADISAPPRAATMAASLLTRLGAKATQGIIDVYPNPIKARTVVLRHHRIAELLGLEIEEDFIKEVLIRLGFKLERQQQGIWKITIPYFRIDIEREVDVIEEIARFYGYDKIPVQIPPLKSFKQGSGQERKNINKVRQLLFHYGFDEVVNYDFIDPEKEKKFNSGLIPVEIRNPVSSKVSLMRTTLIAGLLENIAYNKNRGAEGIHIFEQGNIYFWDEEECVEQPMLALVSTGLLGAEHWQMRRENTDFFQIKGVLEELMRYLGHESFSFKEESYPYFELGYCFRLDYGGESIGFLGLLRKEILDSYPIKDPVWAAEMKMRRLLERRSKSFQYSPIIKYPSVSRDVSFIADNHVSYQDIMGAVGKLSIPYLEKFEICDRFSGDPIPRNKVNLTLRFVFRNSKRTLLAEEVDSIQKKIIDALKEKFNFQLREKEEKIDKRTGKD